jgi:hypothetical protein
MAAKPTPPPLTLAELLESWKQVLKAENKANHLRQLHGQPRALHPVV